MKRYMNVMAGLLLTLVFTASAFAQDKYLGKITAEDFQNSESYDRNLRGECDSSCDVLAPIPIFTSSAAPTTFVQASQQSETRVVSCQSAGFPANYQGTATEIRYFYVQNGVRVPGTETAWTLDTHTCRAPYPCNVQTVTWTAGGNTCSGPTTGVIAHNSTGTANSTAYLRTGSATLSCFDGTLTYQSGTCYAGCAARAISWTQSSPYTVSNCSGNIAAANHTQTSFVSATTGTGSATFRCTNGSWSPVSTNCTIRIRARGCNITEPIIGGLKYRIHTCTSSDTIFIDESGTSQTMDLLVVGGGGGGGFGIRGDYGSGGGGGAGGLVSTTISAPSVGAYWAAVGAGGAGHPANGGASGEGGNGVNGGSSSVFGITALGGGGGGGAFLVGSPGGSGGGGGTSNWPGPTVIFMAGGSGTPGQGNAGGWGIRSEGNAYRQGGGGGGAGAGGATGTSASGSGGGGAGVPNAIRGFTEWYAGGGGGGSVINAPSPGGIGGGGQGAFGTPLPAGPGVPNTGGGGGGGTSNGWLAGANGGSGIVIIRYRID